MGNYTSTHIRQHQHDVIYHRRNLPKGVKIPLRSKTIVKQIKAHYLLNEIVSQNDQLQIFPDEDDIDLRCVLCFKALIRNTWYRLHIESMRRYNNNEIAAS